MQEDFIDAPSLIHPLFYQRGNDKNKYNKSVILLNRDIQQLLKTRGRDDGISLKKSPSMLTSLKCLMTDSQGKDLESQQSRK